MRETELKFQVPASGAAALARAVATATARTTRLQAVYADTADGRLARAGLALRLRKEGPCWVQTLKGLGDGLAQRLEHEVALPAQRGKPVLDPARHDGTPAGAALRAVLGEGALQPLFSTDIRRVHRLVRHAGAVIEIAHDRGRITAGDRLAQVDEIEFELKSGPAAALPALAARWVPRFGLWWDVRTKAERGQRLAKGIDAVPAVRAAPAERAGDDTLAAWRAALQGALAQTLPNLAELADGSTAPEQLHQARVGLRRLRTALRLLAPWSPDEAAAHACEAALAEPFARLGARRDLDVVKHWLPQIVAAGAPPLPALPGPAVEPGDAVARDPGLNVALLEALRLSMLEPPPTLPPTAADDAAPKLLRRAWRAAWADAEVFDTAPVEQQHRARKRLKRLRYATECLLPWLPRKPARRLLRALGPVLDALGAERDLLLAHDAFAPLAAAHPPAWFALGWIAARRSAARAETLAALRALAEADRPWKGGR